MRARIQQWIYHVRGSYWFVPTLMTIAAILLSQATVQLDKLLGSAWMSGTWWASFNQPEGARTLLATVAGSMITVAGVTFSLTILVVSYATSHFGPRLLENFMRDRGNQFTLGTFLATFLYCLMVLRTVRSGSDIFSASENASLFVPHFSVLIAIGMTLASVGVLIYFIHHVPESINIANVLDRIASELSHKIRQLYPESLGAEAESGRQDVPDFADEGEPVHAHHSGYLQGIDVTQLLESTVDYDAIVRLHVRPGDFLMEGQPIATLHFLADNEQKQRDACHSHIRGSFATGVTRTPTQDVHFLLSQFFEIAVRALSPGVNDPLTAIQCIDQLSQALVQLSSRAMPSPRREDSQGKLRVVTTETSWDDIVDAAIVRLIPYARQDPTVIAHLRKRLDQIMEISQNQRLNQILREIADQLTLTN